jgi:hypothetical protein
MARDVAAGDVGDERQREADSDDDRMPGERETPEHDDRASAKRFGGLLSSPCRS